ncbi:MAG: hypothetical protein ACXVHI_02565 [Frankiaceae bacterium]
MRHSSDLKIRPVGGRRHPQEPRANACVHKINAHAEKKVTEEFVRQYKRIRNKDAMLHRVAEVSLESPAEPVRDVIYPVMGGEAGLTELVGEYRARRAHERDKRRVFKSSYTNHYRTGLIKLLQVLEFRSNNTEHQPVLDGLKLILRYAECCVLSLQRSRSRSASSPCPPTIAAGHGTPGQIFRT